MEVKPLFVFRTTLYNIVEKEFFSAEDTKKFIKNFDFNKLYTPHGLPFSDGRLIDVPVFKLGIRFSFMFDSILFKSLVEWGPDIYVGDSFKIKDYKFDKNKLIYTINIPKYETNENISQRRKEEYSVVLDKKIKPIIVNTNKLRQIYPVTSIPEIDKFFAASEKRRYKITKTRVR